MRPIIQIISIQLACIYITDKFLKDNSLQVIKKKKKTKGTGYNDRPIPLKFNIDN